MLRFSIIICNYNYSNFLEEAINSCLQQDYCKTDFEVIVIDDGSTDDSKKILEKFQELKISNLTILEQPNQGQSIALANAINHARGEFICLLDSDDYFLPNKLKELDNWLRERELPEEFFLCHDCKIKNEKDNSFFQSSWFTVINLTNLPESYGIEQINHPSPFSNPCGMVFSSKLLKTIVEALPLNDWKHGADALFAQAALMKTGRVFYLPTELAVYRLHEKNNFLAFGERGEMKPKVNWRTDRWPKLIYFLDLYVQSLNLSFKEKAERLAYLRRQERNLSTTSKHHGFWEPKVSVIITNYNYAKFLSQCIESVLNQTYRNVEIIIVDDCSEDASKEIIQSIEKNCPQIKTIFLTKNLGQLGAIAEAYKQASGDYIVLLDADDFLDPTFLERHIYYHRFMSLTMVTSSDIRFVDEKGNLIHNSCYHSSGAWKKAVEYFPPFSAKLGQWIFAPSSANCLRKTKLLDLFFENLTPEIIHSFRKSGDWPILFYAFILGGSTRVSECLVNFRLHQKNNCTQLHFPTDFVQALGKGHPNHQEAINYFLYLLNSQYLSFKAHYNAMGLKTFLQWLKLGDERNYFQNAANKLSLNPELKLLASLVN
jgi:glycosyltransferase involved in cell wall biosynthesis